MQGVRVHVPCLEVIVSVFKENHMAALQPCIMQHEGSQGSQGSSNMTTGYCIVPCSNAQFVPGTLLFLIYLLQKQAACQLYSQDLNSITTPWYSMWLAVMDEAVTRSIL